jgi:hypothetical protein
MSSEERTTICTVPPVACPDNSKAGPEETEANPGATEAAVERQKLREKEINVEHIGSSEDRFGDRHLGVPRRRGAKKPIEDSVGSRQKLSAARKQVIRRTVPAVRKGHTRKSPGKDSNARGASRGRTHVKSRRSCHNGRRHRDTKKPSYLRTIKTTDSTSRNR